MFSIIPSPLSPEKGEERGLKAPPLKVAPEAATADAVFSFAPSTEQGPATAILFTPISGRKHL